MNNYLKYSAIIFVVFLAFFLAYKYMGHTKVSNSLIALAFIVGGILVGYSGSRIYNQATA